MAGLRLEVREFRDLARFRWVLTDGSGAFLADHEVRLDPASWQYEAFGDLRWYLQWHCVPDRRAEDEARIVGEVGAWIGTHVLGPSVGDALARRRPAIVRVVVPPEAAELLYRPLELAHAQGRPLAVQDVTLVIQGSPAGDRHTGPEPVGERLRVLGLFSLPEGGRSLNLRRERAELVRRVAAIGKATDVRVLQYGVTRERLREILKEAEGWDIIHVSGHGRPGSLVLETAAGQPDVVTGPELARLLDVARRRLKLVTVSACWSGAMLADEQRRLLELPARAHDDPAERDAGDGTPSTVPGALATELADRLGCAVLAMRYPVGDDFALALSGKLYSLLADEGQPLPRAVGITLRELSPRADQTEPAGGEAGTGAFPALSLATPALFGGLAADLRLAAPSRQDPARQDTERRTMAGFPPEPPRFVGRTAVLARASTALAPRSGVPGVLLHGMPGGGKSACALELAYGHEHAFERLLWYKAPDEGMTIDGALTDFALTLERYVDGLQMAQVLVSTEALAAFLPQLTELMEQRRLLIVIDNLESLLSEADSWRDDRWGAVIGAMTGHSGLGRVILTSRRVPTAAAPGLHVEAVDVLTEDEALLLAREMPNLSALKLGKVPGLAPKVARRLAGNAIAIARGHPKLLELAEGQAATPDDLLKLVKTGDQAWRSRGRVPDGFFAGEDEASDADFLDVLATWAQHVTMTLQPAGRDLFWLLCCLEECDRIVPTVSTIWRHLWRDLGRDGRSPKPDQGYAAITARGLSAARSEGQWYEVHPEVAAAGRAQAGQSFRDTVDAHAAAFFKAMYLSVSDHHGDGRVDTQRAVRAGLSAIPYLMRQEEWENAAFLAGRATSLESTRANALAVLSHVEQITRHDPSQADLLAQVSKLITAAKLGESGRTGKALAPADQSTEDSKQADSSFWNQLNDKVKGLQKLNAMGVPDLVRHQVQQLLSGLPAIPSGDDALYARRVRETLLDAGRQAAVQLEHWEEALSVNVTQLASMRERRAPATETASVRVNNYFPLLNLGRSQEALDLLSECYRAFQDASELKGIAVALTGLGIVEDHRGHGDQAIRFASDALRYDYMIGDVRAIASGYKNLGTYLAVHAGQPARAVACHLVFGLLEFFSGGAATGLNRLAHDAAVDLRKHGANAHLPESVVALCRQAGDIPGGDLPGLIGRLSEPEQAEQALRILIDRAHRIVRNTPPDGTGGSAPADAMGSSTPADRRSRARLRWPWRRRR